MARNSFDANGQTLGERIRAARKAKGWSQTELADQAGFSDRAATVSNWERDKTTPNAHDLRAIAITLGVSTDHLLGMERPDAQKPAAADAGRVALEELADAERLALLADLADFHRALASGSKRPSSDQLSTHWDLNEAGELVARKDSAREDEETTAPPIEEDESDPGGPEGIRPPPDQS